MPTDQNPASTQFISTGVPGLDTILSGGLTRDRLYLVTTDGSLACLDASEAAIAAAQAGTLPETRQVKAPREAAAVADTTQVETTRDAGLGGPAS